MARNPLSLATIEALGLLFRPSSRQRAMVTRVEIDLLTV